MPERKKTSVAPHVRTSYRGVLHPVRGHWRNNPPIRVALASEYMPETYMFVLVDQEPDVIRMANVHPSLHRRPSEDERRFMSRALSHETLHSALARIGEPDAAFLLDTNTTSNVGFTRLSQLTRTGLPRRHARRKRD